MLFSSSTDITPLLSVSKILIRLFLEILNVIGGIYRSYLNICLSLASGDPLLITHTITRNSCGSNIIEIIKIINVINIFNIFNIILYQYYGWCQYYQYYQYIKISSMYQFYQYILYQQIITVINFQT